MSSAKPKALYIPRKADSSLWKVKLAPWHRSFLPLTQAYFEEGLQEAFSVSRRSAEFVLQNLQRISRTYDVLVVNTKAEKPLTQQGAAAGSLADIARAVHMPTILFAGSDEASNLPGDDVLDAYDVVVKREPYRDRQRYGHVSSANQQKIAASMLSCPITTALRWSSFRFKEALFPKKAVSYAYDVFFSGSVPKDDRTRENIWRMLRERCSSLRFAGGVYARVGDEETITPELQGPHLSPSRFAETIRRSKINLAIEGIGEFTFRHLEIWYLGGFMISSPSLREIEVPLPIQEGVHYIAYDNEDDLVEKIMYYLEHDSEREAIARAGKEMFDTYYDPSAHGTAIRRAAEPFL